MDPSELVFDGLPVFTDLECSPEFAEELYLSLTPRVQCVCGRVYYQDSDLVAYESGEYLALTEAHQHEPNRYLPCRDLTSWGTLLGFQVVQGCECHFDAFIEIEQELWDARQLAVKASQRVKLCGENQSGIDIMGQQLITDEPHGLD